MEVVRHHHPGLTGTRLVTKSPDVQAVGNNVLLFGTAIADNAAVDAATSNQRFTDYERNRGLGSITRSTAFTTDLSDGSSSRTPLASRP